MPKGASNTVLYFFWKKKNDGFEKSRRGPFFRNIIKEHRDEVVILAAREEGYQKRE